ncbi:MAG: hypothetical protein FJX78_01830 [Armatimonadetes bacterium]|nr:hypothetical protein [Armatimonadota bacterium]
MTIAHTERTDDLSELLEAILRLSKVKAGERVCLLTTHVYDTRMTDAYRVALGRLGADAVHLVVPPRTSGTSWINPLQLDAYAQRILKDAEMVVYPRTLRQVADVSMYTPAYRDILFSGGVRWLDVMVDETAMRRLFPSAAMIDRTKRAATLVESAQEFHLTSDAGTDLRVRKRGRKAAMQVGVADEVGRWDNFGFGFVTCAPEEDQTEGVLVFDIGDSLGYFLGPYFNLLPEQVRVYWEKGRVVRIEGGAVAKSYARFLERLGKPEHYHIAHFGWGTQDKAVWGGPHFNVADWESYYGNVMIHWGHNIFDAPSRHSGLGGRNAPSADWPIPQHSGGVVLNHSLWMDGKQILDRGTIVPADLK